MSATFTAPEIALSGDIIGVSITLHVADHVMMHPVTEVLVKQDEAADSFSFTRISLCEQDRIGGAIVRLQFALSNNLAMLGRICRTMALHDEGGSWLRLHITSNAALLVFEVPSDDIFDGAHDIAAQRDKVQGAVTMIAPNLGSHHARLSQMSGSMLPPTSSATWCLFRKWWHKGQNMAKRGSGSRFPGPTFTLKRYDGGQTCLSFAFSSAPAGPPHVLIWT